MWIYKAQLIVVACCLWVTRCDGLEKDLEVTCLDSKALTITEGGVVADCAFQGLTRTKTINTWLFDLANVLQAVNASHNHIKSVSVFPDLPRVLTLSLDHNSIRNIEPHAFSSLENLQNLDLSHNRISGESLKDVLVGRKTPEQDEPLPIRILFLSNNAISSVDPEVFSNLRYLRDLHLDYNPIVTINDNFSTALRQMPELKLLNLAGTQLSSLPKDAFEGLALTSLLLNGNKFTQVPDLSPLRASLRLLNLNQNPIEVLSETSFSGLQSLSEIVVSGMPNLTRIEAGTFSGLENIRVISCSYNPQLTFIDEKAFWDHKISKRNPLQEVNLNNNALPRLRKLTLPWIKLTRVTLDGNKWVCDCRIHWLANMLRGIKTSVERLADLKCYEPSWLNGTQLIFWKMDLASRHENFPCQEEIERDRMEQEQERLKMEQQQREKALKEQEQIRKVAAAPTEQEPEEGDTKLLHVIVIAGIVALVLIIGSVVAFNKYRSYRPIYNVEKMSSPMHNEMKYMKGSIAEKTQLVQ